MSGGMALAVGGLCAAAYLLTLFSTAQSRSTDFFFKTRAQESAHSTIIIGIDQRSYRELLPQYGAMTRWPRTLYGEVVRALQKAGARVIVFDMFFDAPSPEDSAVATAFREAGNIILPVEAQGPGKPNPYPGVAQEFEVFIRSTNLIHESAVAEGIVNVTTDPDSVVRSLPLLLRASSENVPALALTAVAQFIRRPTVLDAPSTNSTLFGAGRAIPLLATNSMSINFLGPPVGPERKGPFPIIPFVDVLNGAFDQSFVKDKIVLIGLTVRGLEEFSTPTTSNTKMWGVEVLGNAIETILSERYVVPASRTITVVVIFLMAALAAWLVTLSSPFWATIGSLILLGLYVLIAGAFFDAGILLNLIYPPSAFLCAFGLVMAYRVVDEQAEQQKIRELMGQYLSPTVSQWVLQDPDKLQLGGQTQDITVLFSDIRGFTTLAHTLPPQELVSLLNEYMTVMSRIVFKHDGVVDKFIGDAIMAFWNAPMPQPDHARRACQTALEMISALRELQADWKRRSMPMFAIGIGINSGPAVVGNVGSLERLQYTVLGDTTNVASRLEGLGMMYGVPIVIGETTRKEAGPAFEYRELDVVAVKGRDEPLVVYEVMGLAGQLDHEHVQMLDRYQCGLHLYRSRRWSEAQAVFRDIQVQAPDDGPTALYLHRSTEFCANPPPADWNGVHVAKTK
ncbi:MAG: adenylate/guanylate cyclase domain-containing protein [Nitrospirales bacterium]